jgi:hypothetical protein
MNDVRLQVLALATAVTFAGSFLTAAITVALGRTRYQRAAGAIMLACYLAALALRPPVGLASNALVLAGAAGGVLLLVGRLTPPAVLAFLIVASLADLLSFSGGLTRRITDAYRSGASDLLLYLSLVAPFRGRTIPIVGIGDLFVVGASAAGLIASGWRWPATAAVIAAGLVAALLFGIWRGGAPAVPFIAGAVGIALLLARRGPTPPRPDVARSSSRA